MTVPKEKIFAVTVFVKAKNPHMDAIPLPKNPERVKDISFVFAIVPGHKLAAMASLTGMKTVMMATL